MKILRDAAAAIVVLLSGIAWVASSPAHATLTRATIDTEARVRAARYRGQTQLVVDYYRIGRRLAFALPIPEIPRPELPVTGIPEYPWEIWFSWELEERINSLGWAAQWFGDQAAAVAVVRELRTISGWPAFTTTGRIDLCLGHVSRTLCQAYTSWTWLDPETKGLIRKALSRLVEQSVSWADSRYPGHISANEILAGPEPHTTVHNIPFIGLIGAAVASNTIGGAAGEGLNNRVSVLLDVLFQLRREGYSEGVGYDGYLLDFVATWLQSLPSARREAILRLYDFSDSINPSYMLGVPGDLALVAEIADVEPLQMPFHISAQARLQRLQPKAVRAWYLGHVRPGVLRADALACLRPIAERLVGPVPACGVLDARYATVLRTGWSEKDLAVAVATSNSPAGHIHFDFGSITIGTGGRWLVADPGYQQYMPGPEREFTIGSKAHNNPVLNGKGQEIKAGRVLERGPAGTNGYRLRVDMTGCYPQDAAAERAVRTVWLTNNVIVVADDVRLSGAGQVEYSWHGWPGAAWGVHNGWAMIHGLADSSLWFTSPSCEIRDSMLDRREGARGQLTLSVRAAPSPVIWWIFSRSNSPPAVDYASDGRSIRISGRQFAVD